MDLREVSDRIEINDLLTRYAKAVDRKDWDLYRTVFTADAHIDYRSAGGVESGLDEMCDWLDKSLAMFESTQHLIGNVDIRIEGDEATVEAMFHNPLKLPDGTIWFTGGWYHHEMIRTSDGWRSRKLTEESSYFHGTQG